MAKIYEYTSVYPTGSSNGFFITGSKGVIAVDGGGLYGRDQVEAHFAEAGIDPKSVVLIIASHTHVDHTCNLEEMRQLTGAPILVQKNGEQPMIDAEMPHCFPRNYIGDEIMEFAKAKGGMPDDFLPAIKPDMTFEDNFDLTPYGVNGSIIHCPGHSLVDSCVIVDGTDAIIGDLVCEDMFTHGEPTIAYFGFDPDRKKVNAMLIPSIERLLATGCQTFYAGHGGPFTRAQVEKALADCKAQDAAL